MNTQTKQHIQFFARLLLVLSLVAPVSAGQSSGTPPAKPGSSGGSADSSEPKLGFSIETEMLTYKSLQANSEAVACDIARHLFGGEIGPPTENAPCTIRSNSDPGAGIVIVSSETTVFSDFQLWRADMASMIALEARANQFCPATPTVKTRGLPATAAAATPEGQMLPMAKEVLGLFANTESISPVTGTIHDQALMNGVARQLRALRIAVLIPEIYSPYALGGADSANSPYLSNLAKIIASRSCLQGKKDLEPKEQQTEAAEIGSVITSIDQFVGSLNPPPASAGGGGAARTPATGSTPPESPAGLATHLASALTADGLARAIGVNLDGTASTGSLWQHILWLKALESGGSVAKQGNIFGTKTRFSGGAVTTYALYNFDGNLDCSGNVYDFEGSVLTKDFSKTFREQIKDPTKQLAYLRGGCGPAKQ